MTLRMILDFELFTDSRVAYERAHREMTIRDRARRQKHYRPKAYWLHGELWRASR